MKIAIIGGHFTPAWAVIEALSSGDEAIFIGRKHSMEADRALSLEFIALTGANVPFYPISTGRLQRKMSANSLTAIFKLPVGLFQSFKILRREKPNVVLSFGSYVSLPVIFSAFLLGISVVIHEQTQEAGFSNKIGSIFAKKVCISFESSRKFFSKNKTVLTGNPIRKSILNPNESAIDIPTQKSLPLIYITGGSQGSHFINTLVYENLEKILASFNIIHQTGDSKYNDYDSLVLKKENLKSLGKGYLAKKFLTDNEVGFVLKKSTLVIARAGINTVSELIALEKPALLIPLPFAQRNEQLKNAILLKEVGLGELEEQKYLTTEKFLDIALKMSREISRYTLDSKLTFPKNAALEILKITHDAARKK